MFFHQIHHIALICSDYGRSRQFYTEVLGFQIVYETYCAERQSHKLDLRLGAVQLELFSFPNPPARPSRPEAAGLRHLAFAVEDIDAVVRHLERYQIVVEPIRVDPHTAKRFTFFADPDGLPLEVYETR